MTAIQHLLTAGMLLFSFSLYAQPKSNDTVFIKKDPVLGTAQSIYFDHNRNSSKYNEINYWTFSEFDYDPFQWSLNYLKEHRLKLISQKPVLPYRKWLPLQQYKGKLYAYHPCDFYTHFKQSINDTAFIDWTGEGPVANKILSQKKINNTTYTLHLAGMYDSNRRLTIHIIDSKKGIAVFETTGKDTDPSYYLMMAAEKIRSVPLIVNHCQVHKQKELYSEDPDFKKLLKKK